MNKIKIYILFIHTTFLFSCGIYSFSGASIPSEAKSVYIETFPNQAQTIQPALSQIFTEKLKDIFIGQTNLNLSQEKGDLNFSGNITNYNIQPISIESNQTAAQNRLTITVYVEFNNTLQKELNFKQKFSRYKDYNSMQDISEIEEEIINEICDNLIEDIFNKAVVNW
ncbi:MAG: hypothetical protein CMP73_01000 [Flavobacteriales bacterium]|nr:hypothetical protein [Flavobacteriales bacterium]